MTETVDSTPDADSGIALRRLVSGAKFLVYGVAVAVGTLLIVDGVQNYLEYADGGVNMPAEHLLGVVVELGVAFAVVLFALSGAVTIGVERTAGGSG